MRKVSKKAGVLTLLALSLIPASGSLSAQQAPDDPNITVTGMRLPELDTMAEGPEVKGIISARRGDRMQVTAPDGTRTVVTIHESAQIRAGGGLFGSGRNTLGREALLNGLPVTVKTVQAPEEAGGGLVASRITYRNNDFKTASMIRNGTNQRFEEQAAATEALRSRMGDIDQYNIKSTTNVYFDSGRWVLSANAKNELCAAATTAEGTSNALMLVVGYADSTGNEDFNQQLSERRAGAVINYLQQACRWKPYRMLTPTGMAEAYPMASNDTPEGRAQNRRVSVNVLVSKGLDGL